MLLERSEHVGRRTGELSVICFDTIATLSHHATRLRWMTLSTGTLMSG